MKFLGDLLVACNLTFYDDEIKNSPYKVWNKPYLAAQQILFVRNKYCYSEKYVMTLVLYILH